MSEIKQLKGFLNEVLVKVLVEGKEQMAGGFFHIPELFCHALKPLAVAIFIQVLNHHICIIPGKFIFVQIRAFPTLLMSYLLG